MRPLNRKLLRELFTLKGQLVGIVVVVASGIATFAAFRSVGTSLILTRQAFYDESRFGDVFLTARRVPESISERIAAIPGIAHIQTRVTQEVLLDLPNVDETASGTMVSVPDNGQPVLNRLSLRSGRWVHEGADNEVIISTAFADGNAYHEGDRFKAVINGRKRSLTIVGTAVSPEYIIEMPPGTVFPDSKRYGTMYMARSVMEAMADMKGAFNSAAVKLEPGADEQSIREKIDILLKPYGAISSIGRDEQLSNRILAEEIAGVQGQSVAIPTIFLGVAIFLLNISLLRLVSTQRMSIAILKAFGYTNTQIAMHYMGFALIAVGAGVGIGLIGGHWMGRSLTELYARFYRFPVLRFDMPEDVILGAIAIATLAAVLGAIGAVRSVSSLPPAEAMRPSSPSRFKPGLIERIPLLRRLDPVTAMMWRTLERRPMKAMLSILMIGLAMSVMIIGRSMFDMLDILFSVQFNNANRQDASISFVLPRSSSAYYDAMNLPGVMRVERYRVVPADLLFDRHRKRLAITSVLPDQDLVRVVDKTGAPVTIPRGGLVMTGYLADKFGIVVGDTITISLLEGRRQQLRVPFVGRSEEMFGLQAYMDASTLYDLLGEQGSISGVYVQLDPDDEPAFSAAIKKMPAAAGSISRRTTMQSFDENYKENMDISSWFILSFAVIIAMGVVYNSARIALSERATELAQLRILGFTISEITVILVGEQLMLTILSIPVGIALGIAVVYMLPAALSTDLFRLPAVISLKNLGLGAVVIVGVAVFTGFLIWLRLRRLDLIAVLKSRE